jgi:hypothetical protein
MDEQKFGILGVTGPQATNRGVGYSPAFPIDRDNYMMGVLGKYVPENLLKNSLAEQLLKGENIAKNYAPGAGAPTDPRIAEALAQAQMMGQQGMQGQQGMMMPQQQMQGQWVDVNDPAGRPTGMIRNVTTGEVRNKSAQTFGQVAG